MAEKENREIIGVTSFGDPVYKPIRRLEDLTAEERERLLGEMGIGDLRLLREDGTVVTPAATEGKYHPIRKDGSVNFDVEID